MLKQVMEIYEILDSAFVNGEEIKSYLEGRGLENIEINEIKGEDGSTDFVKILIKGSNGKSTGGDAPTTGIVGRLGGIGARPEVIGYVSDGDGALAALSVALKLADMRKKGDVLKGDVIVTTHICPDAPTREHFPVPFMGSPVKSAQVNVVEVCDEMDAVLSIDTTKGNKFINTRGFAISNTVKEGFILKISDSLLEIAMRTSGRMPFVFPISMQDITPYDNGIYHINSIMQPNVATKAPIIGVAITTEVPVAGCATGATHLIDVEMAARFALEVAKDLGENKCSFIDEEEFKLMKKLYGDMSVLQTKGAQ